MIELSEIEKVFIFAIKGHLKKYLEGGTYEKELEPLFSHFYSRLTYHTYEEYRSHLFSILFDLYLKIQDDRSGSNMQIRKLMYATFSKSFSHNQETPIERAIDSVCNLIRFTSVVSENETWRFELDIPEERMAELGNIFVEERRLRVEELKQQEIERNILDLTKNRKETFKFEELTTYLESKSGLEPEFFGGIIHDYVGSNYNSTKIISEIKKSFNYNEFLNFVIYVSDDKFQAIQRLEEYIKERNNEK